KLIEGLHLHERLPEAGAASKALGVPSGVAAEGTHGRRFTHPVGEQVSVLQQNVDDLAEVGWRARLSASKHVGQVPEQPGASEATSTDDHTVTTGEAHHAQGVF